MHEHKVSTPRPSLPPGAGQMIALLMCSVSHCFFLFRPQRAKKHAAAERMQGFAHEGDSWPCTTRRRVSRTICPPFGSWRREADQRDKQRISALLSGAALIRSPRYRGPTQQSSVVPKSHAGLSVSLPSLYLLFLPAGLPEKKDPVVSLPWRIASATWLSSLARCGVSHNFSLLRRLHRLAQGRQRWPKAVCPRVQEARGCDDVAIEASECGE